MEDGADVLVELSVNGEGVIEAGRTRLIAGVDDDVELVLYGELEMAAEEIALSFVVGFLGPAFGRGVKVVEAGFSDGGDFRVIEIWSEEGFEVVAGLVDIAGVDAKAGVNFWVLDREVEVKVEIVFASGEGDHAVDAVIFGIGDEGGDLIWGKFM